jgi:hypothetical protein
MQDAESKVALLAYYVEGVARIARAIPDDYLARVYGRSLFIGVDSFLVLAARLKNTLRTRHRLSPRQSEEISAKIGKLRADYESYYATIRDKLAAHQQAVDLERLLEAWNEIDEVTLTVLSSDVSAVWADFQAQGVVSDFARPKELDDPESLVPFSTLAGPEGICVAVDRVAATRPNTVGMIPMGTIQEKAMRVVTAFEGFSSLLNSGLEQVTTRWYLPEKAFVDLLVVDACSAIDNLFRDRAASGSIPAEECLVKLWKSHCFASAARLESFPRDTLLERRLWQLRNKFCAHLDADVPLKDLRAQLVEFPLQDLASYIENVWRAFREGCAEDLRTKPFLLHGQQMRRVVSVDAPAGKPFRVAPPKPGTG